MITNESILIETFKVWVKGRQPTFKGDAMELLNHLLSIEAKSDDELLDIAWLTCYVRMWEETVDGQEIVNGKPVHARSVKIDDILIVDDEALMAQMDRVRPDWWIKWLSDQDLRQFAGGVRDTRRYAKTGGELDEFDRYVTIARRSALRAMRDGAWVMGNSYLSMEAK